VAVTMRGKADHPSATALQGNKLPEQQQLAILRGGADSRSDDPQTTSNRLRLSPEAPTLERVYF